MSKITINEDDLKLIVDQLALLDSTLKSSARIVGQLRPMIRSIEIKRDSPSFNNLAKENLELETKSAPPVSLEQTDDKELIVNKIVEDEKGNVTKEDVDLLLSFAKNLSLKKIDNLSSAAKEKINHLSMTPDTTSKPSTDVKKEDKNGIKYLVNKYFSNDLIHTGQGSISPTKSLRVYQENLFSTDFETIVNFPIAFYINNFDGSYQFLLKANKAPTKDKPIAIFSSLGTEPEIYILYRNNREKMIMHLVTQEIFDKLHPYLDQSLQDVVDTYFTEY